MQKIYEPIWLKSLATVKDEPGVNAIDLILSVASRQTNAKPWKDMPSASVPIVQAQVSSPQMVPNIATVDTTLPLQTKNNKTLLVGALGLGAVLLMTTRPGKKLISPKTKEQSITSLVVLGGTAALWWYYWKKNQTAPAPVVDLIPSPSIGPV